MLRTTLLSLAAAALLATGLTGVADAKPKPRPATAKKVRSAAKRVAKVSAGSTGQGPATEEECNDLADSINYWDGVLVDRARGGDVDGAIFALEQSQGIENHALDRGCFVVH